MIPESITWMENIIEQVMDYKERVGVNHRDYDKPIIPAPMTNTSRVYDGRIVANNAAYMAVANGRNIEIHPLHDLTPFLKYNGIMTEDTELDEIVHEGNTINIHYKTDGSAIFHVFETRQECKKGVNGVAK